MGLNGNICHNLQGRTISKELTIYKNGDTRFGVVEEHVVDCLEIGSHKTSWLWKGHDLVKSDTGQITGQITENIPLNWSVGPYWLNQLFCTIESFFLEGIDKAIIIAKRYGLLGSLMLRVLWNFHTKNSSSGVQEHRVSEKSLRRIWKQISCRVHKSDRYQPGILQV